MKRYLIIPVKNCSGFTLAEVAVVMVILSLLLGGLFMQLPAKIEQTRRENASKQLEEAREALIHFAISNGRLPCPASASSNGQESIAVPLGSAGGDCSNDFDGFLPGITLGLSHIDANGYVLDPWDRRLHYAVTPLTPSPPPLPTPPNLITHAFTTRAALPNGEPFSAQTMITLSNTLSSSGLAPFKFPGIHVCTSASGIVKTGNAPTCAAGTIQADRAVAIIFTTGNNGAQTPTGLDEQENLTVVDRFFVMHEPREATGTNGAFDDQLIWLSANTLFGRMVSAGRLP